MSPHDDEPTEIDSDTALAVIDADLDALATSEDGWGTIIAKTCVHAVRVVIVMLRDDLAE